MTTDEVEQAIAKVTKEVNKVKSYNTKLAKALVENNIEVPTPNWKDEVKADSNPEEGPEA